MNLLFQTEILEPAKAFLFGLPDAIYHVLDSKDKVRLAVPGISEWHVWWVSLGNGGQCQVRRPGLNEHHIASYDACNVCSASRVRFGPQNHWTIGIFWVSQDLMKVYRESVQVSDMERAKVCMERIVQEQPIDIEIDGSLGLVLSGGGTCTSPPLTG